MNRAVSIKLLLNQDEDTKKRWNEIMKYITNNENIYELKINLLDEVKEELSITNLI